MAPPASDESTSPSYHSEEPRWLELEPDSVDGAGDFSFSLVRLNECRRNRPGFLTWPLAAGLDTTGDPGTRHVRRWSYVDFVPFDIKTSNSMTGYRRVPLFSYRGLNGRKC